MNDDIISFVQNRVRELREIKGVSARDMSLSLGQNHSYISKLENGQLAPSLVALGYITDYFQISLSDFFDLGSHNPDLINELLEESKKLKRTTLENIVSLMKDLNGHK